MRPVSRPSSTRPPCCFTVFRSEEDTSCQSVNQCNNHQIKKKIQQKAKAGTNWKSKQTQSEEFSSKVRSCNNLELKRSHKKDSGDIDHMLRPNKALAQDTQCRSKFKMAGNESIANVSLNYTKIGSLSFAKLSYLEKKCIHFTLSHQN